jgi:hypothetical protein
MIILDIVNWQSYHSKYATNKPRIEKKSHCAIKLDDKLQGLKFIVCIVHTPYLQEIPLL